MQNRYQVGFAGGPQGKWGGSSRNPGRRDREDLRILKEDSNAIPGVQGRQGCRPTERRQGCR
ncbi:MAG: hypothetical protein ABEN55_07480, partial [Bradymonadaceae bacterium]